LCPDKGVCARRYIPVSFFEFTIPTKVEFGVDSLARLGYFASSLGDRALVISENVQSRTGNLQNIENILKGKSIEAILYDGIFPNADTSVIDEVALIARKSRANIIIGIGGARTCNIAKLVAFLCSNDGDVSDYIHGRSGNGNRIPYIEIPTIFREVFALTGSAYVTDAYDQTNRILTLDGLATDFLVDDPALMTDIPLDTAVYTAFDILSLSTEGYISLKVIPLVEPILLRGIEIVYYNLGNYIKNPVDVTVREKLCTAGLFTAIANIITGFGVSFALAMGMNGKNRISKSVMSSLLIPAMMEYNQSVSASRLAKIARVMGRDTSSVPEADAAGLAVEAVEDFRKSLGIQLAGSIQELGLAKDDLAEAAEVAIRFEDINSIPRKASFENLMEMLEKVY
jgi:alcohol dehydrogenase